MSAVWAFPVLVYSPRGGSVAPYWHCVRLSCGYPSLH